MNSIHDTLLIRTLTCKQITLTHFTPPCISPKRRRYQYEYNIDINFSV